ncbi:PEPxxWA-CTERM sorting domain-containing protein [uncultured Phenylobacterium sp.]|uniref:PEPxxWA-CTERM sorting domain-containing protein n=1 Tax=uncultured Phenylobacterium sp. TaxID=349273 RepID=UPI0025D7DC9F|nr:PEPxxWA-CTERM sorting domain-containing protein [uncultured Phenylobacterium sp.]
MRKLALAAIAALGLAAASGAAQADVINFDALPAGAAGDPLVLPGATFTAIGGFNVISSTGSLCTSPDAATVFNCAQTLQVDFDQASSGLSFNMSGINEDTIGADVGDVQIYGGAALLGTVNLIVIDSIGKDLVELTGFSGVTRLVISSTDFGGVLYDDFTFTPNAVPEPSTWALMIGGFGLAGAALRRRRTATA